MRERKSYMERNIFLSGGRGEHGGRINFILSGRRVCDTYRIKRARKRRNWRGKEKEGEAHVRDLSA